MKSTDTRVEALMIIVDNSFEGLLQVLMRLLEVAVFMRLSHRAVVEQLEGQLHRDAIILAEIRPFFLDLSKHIVDLSFSVRPLRLLAELFGLQLGS